MKSFVDTISITIHEDDELQWLEDIQEVFAEVGVMDFEPTRSGKNFYKYGGKLLCNGAIFAELNWGGTTQGKTVQVSIKGQGCSMVKDWAIVANRLLEFDKCKITRLDLAIDVFDGSIKLPEVYKQRHNRELWVGAKGGKPPKFQPLGDMLEDSDLGRTLYIGTRDSDLFTRIYEKGMQLFAKLESPHKHLITEPRQFLWEVDPNNPFVCGDYVRIECEFKAKTTVIPIAVLFDTDSMMASANPYIANLLKITNPTPRIRKEQKVMLDLNGALNHLHKQYGPTLRSALEIYGPEELLRKIVGASHSTSLVEGGILTAKKSDMPKLTDQKTGEIIYGC